MRHSEITRAAIDLEAAYRRMALGSYEVSNAAYGDALEIERALREAGREDLIHSASHGADISI